jgi:hypothetical protein
MPADTLGAIARHQADDEAAQDGNKDGPEPQLLGLTPQFRFMGEGKMLIIEQVREEKD